MKKLSLLFLVLLLAVSMKAQGSYEEVVYLKNGSIIRGVIIETIPNEQIKIQTKDMNVWVYKMEEVEKITKEISVNPSSTKLKPKGYYGIIQFSGGGDTGVNRTNGMIDIAYINGFRVNHYFAVGGGLGLNFMFTSYGTDVGIPMFLDLRGNILKYKV